MDPAVLLAGDRRRAVGERGDAVTVANEQVAGVHPEAPRGELASAGEVLEHRVDALVGAGDGVASGYMRMRASSVRIARSAASS